ncbi:MAG TPA: serine/threonine protein kinase, partial [Candidatus Hydrogenedentes bacterium]|nr:serine/threonine protein kinase [Candidatus Hydrogenedentota bacterium]
GLKRPISRPPRQGVLSLEGSECRGAAPGGWRESAVLVLKVARALGNAHVHGIVHRDLKPDDVKINQDGVVKILDFGIAKNMGETKNSDPISPTTPMSPIAVTAEGTFMGTPVYMSPEQARGKTVDKRTDIWAFGCCLYEALTGDIPFAGESIADTVGAIMEREPDWNKLPDNLPDTVHSLLRRCLEKNARRRFSGAADIAFILEDTLENAKRDLQTGKAFPAPQSSGMPIRAKGIAVLLVILIGAVRVLLTRPSGSPAEETEANSAEEFEVARGGKSAVF